MLQRLVAKILASDLGDPALRDQEIHSSLAQQGEQQIQPKSLARPAKYRAPTMDGDDLHMGIP